MKEEHKSWLDDESNHNYLRRYMRHQKTSIVKLVNGPRIREQFIKAKIALELLDKKIMIVSRILVLPNDMTAMKELSKWLEEQERMLKQNFTEIGEAEFNKEENTTWEKAVHIDKVIGTIIMAQRKSNEKKTLGDDIGTQPPEKRRSTSILRKSDSKSSIDSETLSECIQEVDSEMMRLDDNDDSDIDEKPDSADKTLLGDLGMLTRDNVENTIKYVTSNDLNQSLKSMEDKFLSLMVETRSECMADGIERMEKMDNKLKCQQLNKDMIENINITLESLQLGMANMGKQVKDLEKKIENMITGNNVTCKEYPPEVNRYRESCLRERMKMLSVFSGEREDFNIWKSNVEETLQEFDDVKLPEFILYQWLESKTSNNANLLIRPFKAFPNKPFSRAWKALREKYSTLSDHQVILAKLGDIGRVNTKDFKQLEKLHVILDGLSEDVPTQRQEMYEDTAIALTLDHMLQTEYMDWKETHDIKEPLKRMSRFLKSLMRNTSMMHDKPGKTLNKIEPAKQNNKACWVCYANHDISNCDFFINKTIDKRNSLAKVTKACLNCLKLGHVANSCYVKPCECGVRKNILLHVCDKNTTTSAYSFGSDINLSKAATVATINGDKIIIMADLGAGLSLISPKLIKKWELKPIKSERVNLRGIGHESYNANIYLVKIMNVDYVFYEYSNLLSINQDPYKDKIPRINGQVQLLIGNDNLELIKHDEYHSDGGKTLVKTKIGYFLYNNKREVPVMITVKQIEDDHKISLDNELATEKLRREIVIDDTNIYAPIMIKNNPNIELCSYGQAKGRLIGQWKRFQHDKEYEKIYDNAVYSYIEDNYAIELPKNVKPKNFIPHQLVISDTKKPRLVYACNTPGREKTSLNEIMYKGAISLNKIEDIVNDWRIMKYWICGDIKAMFHQIRLLFRDLGYFCFLYWKKGIIKTLNNISIFVMTRHIFGATDSPHVAVECLNKIIMEKLDDGIDKKRLQQNFYMDDLLLSSNNPETLKKEMFNVKKGLYPYFQLTKFYGNVDGLEEEAKLDYHPTDKILGFQLNLKEDVFEFQTNKWLITKSRISYQDLAGVSKKLFDPLGFVEPYTAYIKLVHSEINMKKKGMEGQCPQTGFETLE